MQPCLQIDLLCNVIRLDKICDKLIVNDIEPVKHFIFSIKLWLFTYPPFLNMCFGCSKEESHWEGSLEYQHMFWLWNKKKNFRYTPLSRALSRYANFCWWFIYKSIKIHCLQIDLLSNVIRLDKICDTMIAHDDVHAFLIVHLVICWIPANVTGAYILLYLL